MIRVSFIPSLFYIIGFINNSTLISSMRLSVFFSNSTSSKLTYSTIFKEKKNHIDDVFLLNSFFWYHWKSWSCPFDIETFLSFFRFALKVNFIVLFYIYIFYYTYAPFSTKVSFPSALKISKKEFRFIGIILTEFLNFPLLNAQENYWQVCNQLRMLITV